MTRAAARWALYLAPLALVPLMFVGVLRAGEHPAPWARASLPREGLARDRCTWYCHNHGCPHRPALPLALSGDRGLYGGTIRALQAAGRGVSRDRGVGYGAANLALFCVAWPGLMYALYLKAVRQRLEIRARRGSP